MVARRTNPSPASGSLRSRSASTSRKLTAIFRIYLRECFAYPASTFIWTLVDAQAAIILPAVWLAAAGSAQQVAGMPKGELVTYYLVSMTLAQFVTCHLMWDMAEDIREGFFSSHLLRPISYFRANMARNLAWRVTKVVLFLPIGTCVLLAYSNAGVQLSSLHFSWQFWLSVLLAHLLSYISAFCVAMIPLWTVEFVSLFRIYYLPENFLSGRLVPLSSLPLWASAVAGWLHFRYTNAFCAEMLLGRLSPTQVTRGLGMQLGWILAFLLLSRAMFRRGLRRYTGAGM